MSAYHYLYPYRHLIHFGFFVLNNLDITDNYEYVFCPDILLMENLTLSQIDISSMYCF